MKQIFIALAAALLVVGCAADDTTTFTEEYALVGYTDGESRTDFGTPTDTKIPFVWSEGDKVWVGQTASTAASIASDGSATFGGFTTEPTGTVYYNMTGEGADAVIPAAQDNAKTLGANGDFGYATIANGAFSLRHATAYLWFDVDASAVSGAALQTITVMADAPLAGKATFDGSVFGTVSEGANTITLTINSNEKPAAAVVLPTTVTGLTIRYQFKVGEATKYLTQTLAGKSLAAGKCYKINATATEENLKDYYLRTLTFEDADAKFTPYTLDYCSLNVEKWSDLIADVQAPGGSELLYGTGYDYFSARYHWYDEGNTNLTHTFVSNEAYGGSFALSSGGIAISNYHFDGDIGSLSMNLYDSNSAYNYQLSIIGSATEQNNFACAYNDSVVGSTACNEIAFGDDVARTIDHLYVTIPVITYRSIKDGSDFSAAYDDDDHLKLVATGIKADGSTSTAEILLAAGGDETTWATTWTKWDLSSLGAVKRIILHMEEAQSISYDDVTYYYCSPLYVAMDNIAVRFE